jgi:hypothetical protein
MSMSRDKVQSVNNIYSVGHQTLDARGSRFLEKNIKVEEAFRSSLHARDSVTRAYDPVLQLEKRTERLKTSKISGAQHDKDDLMRSHHQTVSHLNENLNQLNSLDRRKKLLARELHLMEKTMGPPLARDWALARDPMSIDVVPQTSSFRPKLEAVKRDLDRSGVQFMMDADHYEVTQSNATLKYKNPDKTTLPVKPITPEKFDTAIRSFGGMRSTASADYLNMHIPGSRSGRNRDMGRTDIGQPFDSNVQDYNSTLIQHNKLMRAPRNPRTTLMLSGMGFTEHCTDVALEIVKILNDKHL